MIMNKTDEQMMDTQVQPRDPAPDIVARERWVFTYSIAGDLRFISHRDTLRMFQRAVARASLPVRYTQGFNPHPKLSIPLPLPVGMASQAESIVVEFERAVDGDNVLNCLAQHMPPGLKMIRATRLKPCQFLHPALVQYRLELDDSAKADIPLRILNILGSTTVRVERTSAKDVRTRIIDVRPFIAAISQRGNAVDFTLRITSGGTVKPAEIAGLLGFDQRSINHRIRRMEVQWE